MHGGVAWGGAAWPWSWVVGAALLGVLRRSQRFGDVWGTSPGGVGGLQSGLARFERDGGKREGVHRGVLGAPWGCMMRSWGRRGAAWGRFARQNGFPSTVNISQHQSTSVNIPVNIQSTYSQHNLYFGKKSILFLTFCARRRFKNLII